MNIYQKLLVIQEKLKAPKNQYNSFGKYKYRSCEDILEGVKPLLKETGTILLITDNVELVGERTYIKATAILVDSEKINDRIEVSAYAREDESKKGMDLAQVTGSTSSYARKYALNGLFCIDDSQDIDSVNNGNVQPQNKPVQPQNKSVQDEPMTAENWKKFWAGVKQMGFTADQVHERAKCDSIKDFTKQQAAVLYARLQQEAEMRGEKSA